MTLRIPAKVLLHVCSYDFYDMTLSTGKQRRHMIIRSNTADRGDDFDFLSEPGNIDYYCINTRATRH